MDIYLKCDCGCRCVFAQDPDTGREVGVAYGHGLGNTTLLFTNNYDDELWKMDIRNVFKDNEFMSLAAELDAAFEERREDIVDTFFERVKECITARMSRINSRSYVSPQKENAISRIADALGKLFN